jgi:hypothetical protein
MSPLTASDACARYLRQLGDRVRLIARPYDSRPEVDVALDAFATAAAGFLTSAQKQLQQIGLSHRFHFGLVDGALGRKAASAHDAYAVGDIFSEPGEAAASFLLFTQPFARDIFVAWDAMLSRRELFRKVGNPDDEPEMSSLTSSRPRDPARARYAVDQALLTLEFALLHEFYHVANGHLDAIGGKQEGVRLHAVTASDEQLGAGANLYKVLELDADAMALRHLTIAVLEGETLVAHGLFGTASDKDRFRHLGRSVTLLFRLVELWRRHVRLDYTEKELHPHPDVRDATLRAYLRLNADPEVRRSEELAQGYEEGQDDIIEALEVMSTLAPSFGIVEGMGQDLAIRETEWLVPELNRVRKEGVGPRDFRRLAAQFRQAGQS